MSIGSALLIIFFGPMLLYGVFMLVVVIGTALYEGFKKMSGDD